MNVDFVSTANKIKSKFSGQQTEDFCEITKLKNIELSSMGSNDTEGYQIFTPAFTVKDMVKGVGSDIVLDISKTILEPTSGDGAFTIYILNERLKKILKTNHENFLILSLKALSTVYSIEMDKELILKQRNNVFTLYKNFVQANQINAPDGYFDLIKCIIVTNFMWAMFNSDEPINECSIFGIDIAYKMPDAEKKNFKSLEMPVWEISNDLIDIRFEGVEIDG